MIGRGLRSLTYDSWLEHSFRHDRSGNQPEWYHDTAIDWWEPTSQQAVDYFARLFEEPEKSLASYTDEQIALGFCYFFYAGTGPMGLECLTDAAVPVEHRIRCIRAIVNLFEHLFAPRCADALSHIDEPGAGLLHHPCYMWWDISNIDPAPADHERESVDAAILETMRRTLAIPSLACQESALHGLGHWARAYPEFTATTIDDYLAANPNLRPELARYATAARSGCIQ